MAWALGMARPGLSQSLEYLTEVKWQALAQCDEV